MKSSPVRSCIQRLHAYVPGEQPGRSGFLKLNTNENPYPPSPKVFRAIRRVLDEGLRRYPDPVSARLSAKIASVYGFHPTQVIVGNGSDEILALCLRAFVDERQRVQFPDPTYSLYPVLTQIQKGRIQRIPFDHDFNLSLSRFDPHAALTFICNPNAPSGTLLPQEFLRALSRRLDGVLVVDEAYVDFAEDNALPLARQTKKVLVTRSFSKSFSLAGMRIGFAVGHSNLIQALYKVKDSYNLDRLAQAAAEAALSDLPYHHRCVARIKKTREWFGAELTRRGWSSLPSQANFLMTRPPGPSASEWFQQLRARRILVRWFDAPRTRAYLRITIGTAPEMKQFLARISHHRVRNPHGVPPGRG